MSLVLCANSSYAYSDAGTCNRVWCALELFLHTRLIARLRNPFGACSGEMAATERHGLVGYIEYVSLSFATFHDLADDVKYTSFACPILPYKPGFCP